MNSNTGGIRYTHTGRISPSRYLLKIADSIGRLTENGIALLLESIRHPWIVRVAKLELERRKKMEEGE